MQEKNQIQFINRAQRIILTTRLEKNIYSITISIVNKVGMYGHTAEDKLVLPFRKSVWLISL